MHGGKQQWKSNCPDYWFSMAIKFRISTTVIYDWFNRIQVEYLVWSGWDLKWFSVVGSEGLQAKVTGGRFYVRNMQNPNKGTCFRSKKKKNCDTNPGKKESHTRNTRSWLTRLGGFRGSLPLFHYEEHHGCPKSAHCEAQRIKGYWWRKRRSNVRIKNREDL